jgi:hypothetical protein
MSDSDKVRYFTAEDAPVNPFTKARVAGWYWRESDGEWSAEPAPNGKAEADFYATQAMGAR